MWYWLFVIIATFSTQFAIACLVGSMLYRTQSRGQFGQYVEPMHYGEIYYG